MPDLSQATLRAAFAEQSLFEDKTWQLSPTAWPLTPAQVAELEQIGTACLEFHQALETLYLRSAQNKNLLRNKPLLAPWVADYLDRGKPAALIAHARDPKNRGAFPTVLRPDLLLTDEGFALTELDSVPGGIGLTAFLNRLYSEQGGGTPPPGEGGIVGAGDAMIENFYQSLANLRPAARNPLIAIIVSDEAGTTRDRHFGRVEWNAQAFWLVDTGGIIEDSSVPMDVEIRKQVLQAIGEADLVLLVTDAKIGVHPSDARVVGNRRAAVEPAWQRRRRHAAIGRRGADRAAG